MATEYNPKTAAEVAAIVERVMRNPDVYEAAIAIEIKRGRLNGLFVTERGKRGGD